jgi:hypothetical protein
VPTCTLTRPHLHHFQVDLGGADASIFGSSGAWSNSTNATSDDASLIMTLSHDMLSGTWYTVEFNVTNPSLPQQMPQILARVSGTATVGDTPASTISPGQERYGIANGSMPLYVIVPTFTVAEMGQETPFFNRSNTLTLTLQSNVRLDEGSFIQVGNLVGAEHVDGNVTLGGTGASVFQGSWVGGYLRLQLAGGSIVQSETIYVVTFAVWNPNDEQASPDIYVSYDGNGELSVLHSSPCWPDRYPLFLDSSSFVDVVVRGSVQGDDLSEHAT